MKTKENKSENQVRNPEAKEVHIRVIFEDEGHGFKDLDLVTSTKELLERTESCKMFLEPGDYYLEVVYEELLNRAFRPKIRLDLICNSILNYIGCYITSESIIEKSKDEDPIEIVTHVNVENDDNSRVTIMPIFEKVGRDIHYFNIYEKSDFKLSILSRCTFLTDTEKVFLFRLAEHILVSGDSCLRIHFGELYGFLLEQYSEKGQEDINRDFLSITLNTLQFYDFISYGWIAPDEKEGDKVPPLEIIVFDLDLYEKYFELPRSNQAA